MTRLRVPSSLPLAAAALALMLPATGWAQQNQQQGQQQQQQPQQQREQDRPVAPEVTVQQPAPDVLVEQPAPDVVVRQARPDVDIEQARPDVAIQRGEPDVDIVRPEGPVQAQIERAQPNVEIRQARPRIDIQQAEPEIIVERVQTTSRISIEKLNREQANLRDIGIQDRQDLIGLDVVDREDEELGTVRDLLLSGEGRIQAVIVGSEEGFLNSEQRLVALPWADVRVDAENRRLRVPMEEDEVEQMTAFTYGEMGQRQALLGPQQADQRQPE